MRKFTSYCVLSGAALAVTAAATSSAQATLIYGFETNIPTGSGTNGRPNKPATGPDGFFPNGTSSLTAVQSPTGATEGSFSLQLSTTSATDTFTGAQTQNVPLALTTATSFQYDLTVPAGQADPGYGNLEATYFTTDGALNPDRALNPTPGVSPNIDLPGGTTVTQTIANLYIDPDGVLTVPSTPAAIIAADAGYDAANGFPANVITAFQFDFEHGGTPFTINIDNVQVAPITGVPEPTTLGLLAVGGLATLGRRRRHLA